MVASVDLVCLGERMDCAMIPSLLAAAIGLLFIARPAWLPDPVLARVRAVRKSLHILRLGMRSSPCAVQCPAALYFDPCVWLLVLFFLRAQVQVSLPETLYTRVHVSDRVRNF